MTPWPFALSRPARYPRAVKRLLLALSMALALAGPATAAPARMSAQDAYELGLRYLKSGSYTKALEQLNRVRTYYRDDPYALKAELAIADIHFKKNEWDLARSAYEDFRRAHPRYRELDFVVYRLGLTLYKKAPTIAARDQTWTRQAVDTWTRFGASFPESKWKEEVDRDLGKAQARLARKELIIARFYERREAWGAVIGRVEPLLKNWPASPDREEAMILLGTAYAWRGETDLAHMTQTRLQQEFPKGQGSAAIDRAMRQAAEQAARDEKIGRAHV